MIQLIGRGGGQNTVNGSDNNRHPVDSGVGHPDHFDRLRRVCTKRGGLYPHTN